MKPRWFLKVKGVSADLAPLVQSRGHDVVLQMGDPQSGWRGRDERLPVALHLYPGDEISIGIFAEFTDGGHISLWLKQQENLLHPDCPCHRDRQALFSRHRVQSQQLGQACVWGHLSSPLREPLSRFLFGVFSHNTHLSSWSFNSLLSAEINLQLTKERDVPWKCCTY